MGFKIEGDIITTQKVYGYCIKCRQRIISVTKSDQVDNKNDLYYCSHCDAYRTFDFSISTKVKKASDKLKNVILENEDKKVK